MSGVVKGDVLTSSRSTSGGIDGIVSSADATAITIGSDESVTFSGDLVPSTPLSNRNHLINGDFQVAQRGTSFVASANNDYTYNLDRWYLLSDTNDVVDVTQSSTAPTNQLYSIGLDVETVNKKFGIAQIIEQKNCVGLIGNAVTFSFKAKVSATTKLDNVKAGIIAWSSTADEVTSDVVSAWAVEGTNPTLASNLTFENTPANLSVTTSWATYSVSANIDTSSTTNVIVFIWSDVTDTTAGDFLYITDCQLEQGSNATPYERRSYGEELIRCQRYFYRFINGTDQFIGMGSYLWSGQLEIPVSFPTTMRQNATLAFVTVSQGYTARNEDEGVDTFSAFAGLSGAGNNTVMIYASSDVGGTVGQSVRVYTTETSCSISFLAEL